MLHYQVFDRFLDLIQPGENDCWEMPGLAQHSAGYAIFSVGGKQYLGHRVAYECIVGKIAEGMTIDHLCRNRACVNPEHLECVTKGENTLRGESPSARNRRKTECRRGHPFDEANTLVLKRGGRECRICRNEKNKLWMREYEKKKKGRE